MSESKSKYGIKLVMSSGTVSKVIHKDLKKKHKLYLILPKNIAESKIIYRKLFEKHLAEEIWKFSVTHDAACVYLNHCKNNNKFQFPNWWDCKYKMDDIV